MTVFLAKDCLVNLIVKIGEKLQLEEVKFFDNLPV